QNPEALALMQAVENQEIQANEEVEKARRFAQRKAEGQALYKNAMSLFESGKLKPAQSKFKRFVNERYPGLNQQEDEALRIIASIEEKEKQRITELLQTCRGAVERKDLKAAITSCEEVLKEDRNNKDAREQKNKAWNLLKREM